MLENGVIRAAGIVSMLLAASLARAEGDLARLLPDAAGASACFTRVYDTTHLKAHPRQKVRVLDLVLSRKEAGGDVELRLSVSFAGSDAAPARVYARCADAGKDANLSEAGRKLVPSFPHKTGIACQALAGLSVSGEASSAFPVALSPDGKSLTLYLRDNLVTFSEPVPPEPATLSLGPDDRIFRLGRTEACGPVWR